MNEKELLEFKRFREKKLAKRRRQHFNDSINTHELNLVAMMDVMTILLVFLLKSYSVSAMAIPVGAQISVPMSNNEINPEDSVKITITKTGVEGAIIAVDDKAVVQLDVLTLEKLKSQSVAKQFMIDELKTVLEGKSKNIEAISKINTQVEINHKVSVIADKSTPYWLLTSVLFTSAESGFDQYQLVALREVQN